MENTSFGKYDLNISRLRKSYPFQRTVEELREEIDISLKQIEGGEVIEEDDILRLLRQYQ
jgi:hypothetical protein